MTVLLDLIWSQVFSGVPSNAAWDIIKAAWAKSTKKSREEICLDAFQKAFRDIEPHLRKYTIDGDVELNRTALQTVLNDELTLDPDKLLPSDFKKVQFTVRVAKALREKSVLIIGGHNLAEQDYLQLIENFVRHVRQYFTEMIVSEDTAFRHAMLIEAEKHGQGLAELESYLSKNFPLSLAKLQLIESDVQSQSKMMEGLVAKLDQFKSFASDNTGDYRIMSSRRMYNLFVACPSDVDEERNRIQRVIEDINQPHGLADQLGCTIRNLDWRDVVPGMGRPEDVVLEQLPIDTWDVFVGILWTRFGTPSGKQDAVTGIYYNSGTEEEFTLAYRSWLTQQRPFILFYRCRQRLAVPEELDLEQLERVRRFWKNFEAGGNHPGLVQTYKSPDDLERRFRNDITRLLHRLVQKRG